MEYVIKMDNGELKALSFDPEEKTQMDIRMADYMEVGVRVFSIEMDGESVTLREMRVKPNSEVFKQVRSAVELETIP